MEVRAKGGKGPLLFEWDPETQTVDLIRKDMYYKVHLDTEQRKQHMREVMIQKWREKCGESNDYTGDDKPVHGNADQ